MASASVALAVAGVRGEVIFESVQDYINSYFLTGELCKGLSPHSAHHQPQLGPCSLSEMTKYGIKVIQGNLWMKVLDVQDLLYSWRRGRGRVGRYWLVWVWPHLTGRTG